MVADLSRQKVADELNGLCLALFDGWCERGGVVQLASLACLMHGWPLIDATPLSLSTSFDRLPDKLPDPQCWHLEDLSDDDSETIRCQLSLVSQQAATVRTSTN